MKQQEYEVKLQTSEDNHRHAMMEVRQMLAGQQRMSAKYVPHCIISLITSSTYIPNFRMLELVL